MKAIYHAIIGTLFAASAACVVLGAAEASRPGGLPVLAVVYALLCVHFLLSVQTSFPEEA